MPAIVLVTVLAFAGAFATAGCEPTATVEEQVAGHWEGETTGAELVFDPDNDTYALRNFQGRWLEGPWAVTEDGAVEIEVDYREFEGIWTLELEGDTLRLVVEDTDIDETFVKVVEVEE
jgi:hypothetical protein